MDQLDFPFPLDETALQPYLAQVFAIQAEQERLREELRLLNETYADTLPLRALRAATKIVLTTRKLAEHPKEPLDPTHLTTLCTLVEQHLDAMATALNDTIADGTRVTVTRTTGDITRAEREQDGPASHP